MFQSIKDFFAPVAVIDPPQPPKKSIRESLLDELGAADVGLALARSNGSFADIDAASKRVVRARLAWGAHTVSLTGGRR